MNRVDKGRFLRDFLLIAFIQAAGFPLVSWLFGLGNRLHAPSWIVIVLTSGIMAALAGAAREEQSS